MRSLSHQFWFDNFVAQTIRKKTLFKLITNERIPSLSGSPPFCPSSFTSLYCCCCWIEWIFECRLWRCPVLSLWLLLSFEMPLKGKYRAHRRNQMADNQNEKLKAITLHDLGQFLPYVSSCRTSFRLFYRFGCVCTSAAILFPGLIFLYVRWYICCPVFCVFITHFDSSWIKNVILFVYVCVLLKGKGEKIHSDIH